MLHLKITLTATFSIAIATLTTGCQSTNLLQAKIAIPTVPTQPVLSPTEKAKVALAEHLKNIKAKFYGAYWCPYCHKQKDLFGQAAISKINYIECDPKGENPQTQACKKEKVRSFPTWEINGQLYPGLQSLEELANLSEYKGDRNFGE
ncbi:MAG: hypothetical protein HC908_05845 [Calothrix sp. SM1_7_51]|nr:hypothetical protein [Calothrix sp. SM1_7_51]